MRTRLRWEIILVFAVTLGQSAIYSILQLVRSALAPGGVAAQQTQLNPSRATEAVWDVIYGVLDVAFDLALVGIVIYLLWEPGKNVFRLIGLDFRKIGSDLLRALAIGLCIGVPGLGLYVAGRLLGITSGVIASPETVGWWMAPVLLLSAARAGVMEEVIMLGYLFDRFRRLGVGVWATILTSAVIRAAYHSYQGFGPIIGNFVMGIAFGWAYQKWGRVMPLVIAHTLIDIVAFLGYPLAYSLWPALFS